MRWPTFAFGDDDSVNLGALGQQAPALASRAGFDGGAHDQDPAGAAARRPAGAVGAPAGAGEAHAGARPGPRARRRARRRRGGAGHRARRTGAHVGDLRPRRGRGHGVLPGRAHRTHPGQRADRGRRPRRGLQQPDADVLAGLRHLGRLDAPPRTSTTSSCSTSRRSPTGVPRRSGSGCPPTPSSTPGRWRTCATSTLRDRRHRHRRRQRGQREWSTWCAASSRTHHVQVFSEVVPEPDETLVRRGVELLDRVRPDLVVAVGGGSVHRRGQGDAALPRAPGHVPRRPHAALPRPAQAGGRLPAGPAHGAAGRRPDHRRHRLRGLAGGGAHGRAAQGDPGRLLAGPRRRDRRPDADAVDAALGHRSTAASTR